MNAGRFPLRFVRASGLTTVVAGAICAGGAALAQNQGQNQNQNQGQNQNQNQGQAPAPSPPAAPTARELEERLGRGLENAAELLEQLPTLQRIEADEAALRGLLNDTHDELEAERARSAALEAQLRALTGEAGGTGGAGGNGGAGGATPSPEATAQGPAATPEEPESARWLALPALRVNALGIIDSAPQRIGRVAEGAEAIVPVWPRHATLPEGVAWPTAEVDGNRTRIVQAGPLGDLRVLATLKLEGREAVWSWAGSSPGDSGLTDRWFESLLRRSTFEAQRAGVALSTHQLAPTLANLPGPLELGETLRLEARRDLGIDPAMGPVAFAIERDGARAVRLSSGPASGAWVLRTASLFVELAGDEAVVSIRRGPGFEERVDAIERQRRLWQGDLTARPGSPPPDPEVRAQAEAEIARLDDELAKLSALRVATSPRPSAEASASTSPEGGAPVVRLVDPETGVVLTRLVLSRQPLPAFEPAF